MNTEIPENLNEAEDTIQERGLNGAKQRILQSTAFLPSLFTLGNGLAGFGAIHFATKIADSYDAYLSNLATACWLLVLSMMCDMLDGMVARMTRKTSDFGGQLDSLCDVISFGVAPAIIMLRMLAHTMGEMDIPLASNSIVERSIWAIAAIYVACCTLRLARFNVENEPDESAHMAFTGLPSPGAAVVIIGLVLLFENLVNSKSHGWLSSSLRDEMFQSVWFMGPFCIFLALITLFAGLLMVSRIKYPHIINQYIRGKKRFNYIVKFVVIVLALIIEPMITIGIGTVAFVLSGPVKSLFSRKTATPKV